MEIRSEDRRHRRRPKEDGEGEEEEEEKEQDTVSTPHKVCAQEEHSLIPNLKLMTEAELNESRPLET